VVGYVVKLEPIASTPAKVVGDWFGPAIQRFLSDPRPSPPRPAEQPRATTRPRTPVGLI